MVQIKPFAGRNRDKQRMDICTQWDRWDELGDWD